MDTRNKELEKLRKLVEKNGLILHIKGTYDVSGGGCSPSPGSGGGEKCARTYTGCTVDADGGGII